MATLTTSTRSPTKRKKLEVFPVVTKGTLTPLRTKAEIEAHDETSMYADGVGGVAVLTRV
jgi:hypothetical protein